MQAHGGIADRQFTTPAPDVEEDRQVDIERLAQHLEAETAGGRFSGVVSVTSGGETLFERAFGLADRAGGLPMTLRTRLGVASVGKAFTAVAIARLVERGALSFDTRVVDVLPLPLRPRSLAPTITLHHLLAHTSGLADYFDEERLGTDAYARTWETFPSYRARRPADYLPLFAGLPPQQEPGGAFSYCNAGYILLGLVIEVVTGLPYPTAIREHVFDRPAWRTRASFRWTSRIRTWLSATSRRPRQGIRGPATCSRSRSSAARTGERSAPRGTWTVS